MRPRGARSGPAAVAVCLRPRVRVATPRSSHDPPTAALRGSCALPMLQAGYSADIREAPVSKLSSSPLEAAPITPGSSLTQASRIDHRAELSAGEHIVADRHRFEGARFEDSLVESLEAAAEQDDPLAGRELAHAGLRQRSAARRQREHRPPIGDAVERGCEHVWPEHHPRPAARGRVVDAAMLVGGEVADVGNAQGSRCRPAAPGRQGSCRAAPETCPDRASGRRRGTSWEPPLSQSIGLRMDEPTLDCLIVGGGPAGLTAAIYLARFHLDILVVDGGKSRASWIPCTRNSRRLPRRNRRHRTAPANARPGVQIWREDRDRVRDQAGARRETGLFTATWGSGCATARTVLLATGVTNRRPPMDEELHDDALARGLVRYCPICDGYEVTDKKVGVIGSDSHGVAEALVHPQLHRRRDADRAGQGDALKPEDHAEAEGCRDRLRRRAGPGGRDRRATASSSTPPKAITPSTASIRRWASDTHTQLAEMVGARRSARRLHPGRRPPAHQRARPLCGRRRRHRPRPDQPRDGRRRSRRDDDPQRSCASNRAGASRSHATVAKRKRASKPGTPGRGRSGRPRGRRSRL